MYAIATAIGLWFFFKTRRFLSRAKKTTGKVVDSSGYLTIDMRGTESPVIEFMANGKKYTFEGRVAVPWKRLQGKSVSILYNPDDPSEAVLDSFVELHMAWIIFLSVGILGSLFMIFILPLLPSL
jgi:hypothetical protein